MKRPVIAVSALLLTAGCGEGVVIGESTVAAPYDGPMHVEAVPDHPDVMKRSGAAGRALECDGRPYLGGSGYDSGPEEIGSDARAGFAAWVEVSGFTLPPEGYVVERDDGERVLFSYDMGDATKVAVIVKDGIRGGDKTGWGVESWASCDPSELPERVTEALDIGVWTDAEGRRVPVTTIRSSQGDEHCGWQDITFLDMSEPPHETQFLRDPEGELVTGYDATARVPSGATDTGFSRDGRRLWTTDEAAYLVSTDDPGDVERWPVATEPGGCI